MVDLHFVPSFVKSWLPQLTWNIPSSTPTLFLTFDDGPIPEVTEFVLETLKKYEAKATFFCVGDNIRKHPHIFKMVLDGGHSVGNHTFNHLKGWQTPDEKYIENIAKCSSFINEFSNGTVKDTLFRPPYGRISKSQIRLLLPSYKIIMWDVLTCDYNPSLSVDSCLRNSIKHTKNGSVVVFHDSVKSIQKLKTLLPSYIEHFKEKGYKFEAIPY